MANEIIREEFLNKVKTALASARSVGAIDHTEIRGEARENFVQNLLSPMLPPYVEFGSGKIIDSKSNYSAEMDVIIYSRQTMLPLLLGSNHGIYPVEGCIYAIEVKSKLTAKELQTTIEKFLKLRDLYYLPPVFNERYKDAGSVSRVIPLLFAFDTDLTKGEKSELERYMELDLQANSDPMIPVFCVAGRGYWWFKRENEPDSRWIRHLPTENNDEVVDLIGDIADTIPQEIVAKGKLQLGGYIHNSRWV
tara:strand:+ start:139 stop:888 length:750 start_codon:yes stop_codon:yes gene_type:complete